MIDMDQQRARGARLAKQNGYGANPESANPGYVGTRKRGGRVKGKAAHHRPDRRARRAEGGAVGHADEREDAAMIKSAIRQHETAEHGGKHEPIKLAAGGQAKGKRPALAINIKTGGGGRAEKQAAAQRGMQVGAALGARAAASRGAMGPPMPPRPMPPPMPGGGGGMPPGGPPMGGMPPPRPAMPPGAPVRHGGAVSRDRHGRFKGGAV